MEYVILIATLFGIIFGANNLVDGATAIAKKYKISDFIIGALIVGIGTSAPELIVSIIGAIQSNSDIAIGNVVGSNIFNIFGILGLTAIIFPIPIKKQNFEFEILYCIAVSILLIFCLFTWNPGNLGNIEGLILLGSFVLYIILSYFRNQETMIDIVKINIEPTWKSILKIVSGLILLIVSCEYFVNGCVSIAKTLGLTDSVIALTLIACGTSLPELSVSVAAAFKKNTQLALGNIIGSNIFNISFILGTCSQITTLHSTNIGIVDYLFMIGSIGIILVCGAFGKINRFAGILMISTFVLYTIYLLSLCS